MADQRQPGLAGRQARLQHGEPGVVEVVGRLVEQQDVGLGQEHGGETEPCLLPARQFGHVPVQKSVAQALAVR